MELLPSGVVTFLFTDIEGSTKLIDQLGGEVYALALVDHRRILREAVSRGGGVEVGTEGDSLFAAFSSATGAVRAAAEAQKAFASGPLRVRMGLHTGTAQVIDNDYVGADVHRAARIAAAAHGGQVLVSSQTAALADIDDFTDLGEHRLKDVPEPVALLQLGSERFPPLRTISNSNLPRPASPFVGREREVLSVTSLLRGGGRLLTLTGPGGSGKSRLAIEAAGDLAEEFKAGAFWVTLASLKDPTLVLSAIASTVGAKNGLVDHVGEREMLLVLDNFEQVVEAAPEVADLVERCPRLHVMVTSRELLRVRGEREFPVPTLAEPEAVALFCLHSGLAADDAVVELCRRLDNLPLAIELAAAWTRVESPGETLKRLPQRLDLWHAGRDSDPRQQTLRATIEWSYQLLPEEERRLFARLAVFLGGSTLEAAEKVAEADVVRLRALVEKNLIRQGDDWFWMLETIRQYAAERLEESGEAVEVRRRHAVYCAELADRVRLLLAGPEQDRWRKRADGTMANFRAALQYAAAHDPDLAVEIASGVQPIWALKGDHTEALALIDAALSSASSGSSRGRARALADRAAIRMGRGFPRPLVTADLDEAERLALMSGDPWARYRVLETKAQLAAVDRQIGLYLDLLRNGLEAMNETGLPWASRPRYLMAIEYADNGLLAEAPEHGEGPRGRSQFGRRQVGSGASPVPAGQGGFLPG